MHGLAGSGHPWLRWAGRPAATWQRGAGATRMSEDGLRVIRAGWICPMGTARTQPPAATHLSRSGASFCRYTGRSAHVSRLVVGRLTWSAVRLYTPRVASSTSPRIPGNASSSPAPTPRRPKPSPGPPSSPSTTSSSSSISATQGHVPSPPPSATAAGDEASATTQPRSATLAWLEGLESKLQRGGKKVQENARTRTERTLRRELAEAVRAGRLDEAERLWSELRGRVGATRMDEASFHLLMNAYAQRGHLRRVQSYYAHMREWRVRPSVHTFSIIFNAYANLGTPSPAYWQQIKKIKEVDMPRYNLSPTVEIYNVLIKACLVLDPERSNKEIKQIISEMKERQLTPDIVTYDLWMQTAARGNNSGEGGDSKVDIAAAFEVLEEMRKNRIKPDLHIYNQLLKICNEGSTDDQKIGLELYKELAVEGITPDHHTFDLLMMTCMKQRRYQFANELFGKAIELHVEKKIRVDTQLCNSALRVCTRSEGKNANSTEAQKTILASISRIVKFMSNYHLAYNEDTYACLVSAYMRAGVRDKVVEIFEQLRKKSQFMGKKIIGALVNFYSDANDLEGMEKIMRMAIEGQVRLPERIIEQASRPFVSQRRRREWEQLRNELNALIIPQHQSQSQEPELQDTDLSGSHSMTQDKTGSKAEPRKSKHTKQEFDHHDEKDKNQRSRTSKNSIHGKAPHGRKGEIKTNVSLKKNVGSTSYSRRES